MWVPLYVLVFDINNCSKFHLCSYWRSQVLLIDVLAVLLRQIFLICVLSFIVYKIK